MAEIDITRISSKGQIVIPFEMRKHLKEGDKLLIIKNGEQLILKKASEIDKNFSEDLEFAKRTEEAYKRHEKGDFVKMNFDKFIEEMKKW
jgi:AbrB family looped-hinge helix DNA binding protein